MIDIQNFWDEPFEEILSGLSESDFTEKEKILGISLPTLYRDLLLVQNGGSVKRPAYIRGENIWEIFINGSELSPLEDVCDFAHILSLSLEPDEIEAEKLHYSHCHTERLIVISSLAGNGYMCLDYGWMQESVLSVPEVIVLSSEGMGNIFGHKELLRVTSFEAFFEGLTYAGMEAEYLSVGLATEKSLESVAGILESVWGGSYTRSAGGESYTGSIGEISDEGEYILVSISENKRPSGTWYFRGNPECTIILDLVSMEGYASRPTLLTPEITALLEKITSQLGSYHILLIPYPSDRLRSMM